MANTISINITGNNASLLAAVQSSISALNQLGSQGSGGLNNVTVAADRASGAMGGFIGWLKGGLAFAVANKALGALAVGITAVGDAMIGFNMKMEESQIAFETFIGSADGARYMLKQLNDFAASTPFRFNDVQEAAKKFMAFGWAAQDVIPTLTAVGDAVAAVGGGKEKIDRVTVALGQMKAKGKVQGDELLQLAEAGIPAYDILAEKLNMTGSEVANIGKHAVDADTAIKALTEGMEERFGGMMAKMANTTTGMISTIEDNFVLIASTMGKSVFEAFRGIVQKTRDFTQEFKNAFDEGGLRGVFEKMIPPEWQKRIEDLFNNLAFMGQSLAPILSATFSVIGDLVGLVIDVFNGFAPYVNEWLAMMGDVFTAVSDAFTPLADLVSQALSAVFFVFGWFRENTQQSWTDIFQFFDDVTTAIKDVFAWLTNAARSILINGFGEIGQGIIDIWNWISTKVGELVDNMVNGILDALGPVGDLLRGLGTAVSSALSGAAAAISKFLTGGYKSAVHAGDTSGNPFQNWLNNTKTDYDVEKGYADFMKHQGHKSADMGDSGTGNTNREARAAAKEAEQVSKEELNLLIAQAELAKKLAEDTKKTELDNIKYLYDQRLKGINDYYTERIQKEKELADLELAALAAKKQGLEDAIAAEEDPSTQIKLKTELLKTEGEIELKTRARNQTEIKTTREMQEQLKAYKEMKDKLVLEDLQINNKTKEAAYMQIDQAYKEIREKLVANKDTEGIALLDKIVDKKKILADIDEIKQKISDIDTLNDAHQTLLDTKHDLGMVTQDDYDKESIRLAKEYADALEKQLTLLKEKANFEQDPALQAQAIQMEAQIMKLRKTTASWKSEIAGTLKDGFTDFFESLLAGAKSASSAFRDLAKSILSSLAQIAAKRLSTSLMTAIGITGFADGGLISGPGTGTSDSIVARLSNGEYVVPASIVRKYGIAFFEALRLGFNPSRILPNMTGRFATGGLVATAGGGSNVVTVPVSINGVNGTHSMASRLRGVIEETVIRVLKEQTR